MQRNENSLTLSPAQLKKSYPAAPVVTVRDGQVVASSLDVAAYFGKRHDNVLQNIGSLLSEDESNALNFQAIEYTDARGRKKPAFCMNRDGFMLLIMSFTGPKATAFKKAYIREFNRMEAALQSALAPVVPALPDFTNPAIAARAWADQFDRADAAERVLHRFSTASGLIGQRDAAKALGIGLREVGSLLIETFEWAFRDDGGKLKAYAEAQRGGFLKERAGVTKAGHAYVGTYLTPKGLKTIAEYLCKPLTDAQISGLLTGPEAAND